MSPPSLLISMPLQLSIKSLRPRNARVSNRNNSFGAKPDGLRSPCRELVLRKPAVNVFTVNPHDVARYVQAARLHFTTALKGAEHVLLETDVGCLLIDSSDRVRKKQLADVA